MNCSQLRVSLCVCVCVMGGGGGGCRKTVVEYRKIERKHAHKTIWFSFHFQICFIFLRCLFACCEYIKNIYQQIIYVCTHIHVYLYICMYCAIIIRQQQQQQSLETKLQLSDNVVLLLLLLLIFQSIERARESVGYTRTHTHTDTVVERPTHSWETAKAKQ